MALAVSRDDRLRELPCPAARVRLWAMRLEPRSGDLRAALDATDRARLAAMRVGDGGRFLARRAMVRALVGELAGCSPQTVELPDSTPRTVVIGGQARWYISRSSTGDLGLLALADRPVGVDVERLPGPPDAVHVSEQLLAPAEHAWIVGGTGHGRLQGATRFLRVWVRKEAVVKCTGEGLSRDLRSFVVDARTASAQVASPDGRPLGIHTYAVDVPGAVCAVALADRDPVPLV